LWISSSDGQVNSREVDFINMNFPESELTEESQVNLANVLRYSITEDYIFSVDMVRESLGKLKKIALLKLVIGVAISDDSTSITENYLIRLFPMP
jgi:hypothetical protein